MKLIIAEKPSVARDLAQFFGGVKRKEGYLEAGGYTITWAIGHLVSLADADEYDPKFKRWHKEDLPILPTAFRFRVIPSAKAQYAIVSRLLKQADEVVVATDAGREGQLIYELIAARVKYKGQAKRLWLSSYTEEGIRDGLSRLKDNRLYRPLYEAGLARAQADWLVGINATRAISCQAGTLLPVGRVQTPTLAMIVRRDEEIESFQSEPYFEVVASFQHAHGAYQGVWTGVKGRRLQLKEDADRIVEKVKAQTGQVTAVNEKRTVEQAPRLFDLTTLQRRANQLFGYTAQTTLKIAQSLYETHKVLTYPRTDSRYISPDVASTLRNRLLCATETLTHLRSFVPAHITANARVVNVAKVTDHHAIIPTERKATGKLTAQERAIYELVTKTTIAALLDAAEWAVSTIETTVLDERFVTQGRVLVKAGWRQLMSGANESPRKGREDEPALVQLPPMSKGDACFVQDCVRQDKQTKPPARYTEATLLSAMEHAGKQVEEAELADAMKERGLGTPATRAGIIEKLKRDGYIEVEAKKLVSTRKGRTCIQAIDVPALLSPEMTGEWEFRLKEMEQGRYAFSMFIEEVKVLTSDVVGHLLQRDIHVSITEDIGTDNSRIGTCPLCGGQVIETSKAFSCSNWRNKGCTFAVWKVISGHRMTVSQVKMLIEKKSTRVLSFTSSKTGKPFKATLQLDSAGKVTFQFQEKRQTVGTGTGGRKKSRSE